MLAMILNFLRNEAGVTAIEYGLIGSLIGAAIVFAVSSVGSSIAASFTQISNTL